MKVKVLLLVFIAGVCIGISLQAKHDIVDDIIVKDNKIDDIYRPDLNGAQYIRSQDYQSDQKELDKNNATLSSIDDVGRPYIIITSDIHLASPEGRFYPENNQRFEVFLEFLSDNPPDLLFINGDIIDNAVKDENGRTVNGDIDNWVSEKLIYDRIKKKYPDLTFLESLGRGHDYGGKISINNDLASRRGVYNWQGYDLIWFTVNRASFLNGILDYNDSMSEEDYRWIEKQLEAARQPILISHIPIKTNKTSMAGDWPNNKNLTIDYRDQLYSVIDKYSHKIVAIFNGHIHEEITTSYKGIPVYLCPFIENGGFCAIEQQGDRVLVKSKHFVWDVN